MDMDRKTKKKVEESFLMIEPLAATATEHSTGGESGESDNAVLQLQLTMATSSINHEYARLEFDDTLDVERKEELLGYMNDCREKYFEARQSLMTFDPYAVQDFEADLLLQKQKTLNQFNA